MFYIIMFRQSLPAGNGLNVDEYVRKAYRFAYSDCIEVGPVTCLPDPPDPNELYFRQSRRQVNDIVRCYLCFISHLYSF